MVLRWGMTPRHCPASDRLGTKDAVRHGEIRLASCAERRIVGFMDIFPCPKCGAKYRVKRLFWHSSKAPICESCGADFPKTESGAWLSYERADPVKASK